MMAGKERGSFRPLGLRMQDFSRRLMRHYVSPQDTPPLQNFVPSPGWQADSQTPLIWDEPEQQEIPPAENWSADIPPAQEAPAAAPRPPRRKPAPPAAPAQPPTVQRKADSEQKIDPRLLAILAAHQVRETRVAEIRERKTAQANDIQRQAETSEGEALPRPRRNRASFDYVETKALLPPDEEMGRSAPPKMPPSDVIQPARETNPPDDDDSEESSQAGIIDTHVSQPSDQTFPSDVVAEGTSVEPVVQRAVDNDPESADLTPEDLPQIPDDEAETEPVHPLVYGLPEFPRVAEEPELFGEREITPPPAAPPGEEGKPELPVSHSTDSPASLQREMMPNPASLYTPDSQPEFSAPVEDISEADSYPPVVQREIDVPPTPNVRRRKRSSSTAQPPVNQPTHEQPPRIQRQQPEITAPNPESTAWENDDGVMMDAESDSEAVDTSTPAQPFVQGDIEPSAEIDEGDWIEPEADIEAPEESAPPVFNQTEPSSQKPPRIQRQPQSPPDIASVHSDVPDVGQGDMTYFDDSAYDQYAETEPIESTFVQRDFDAQLEINEPYWSDAPQSDIAPDEPDIPAASHDYTPLTEAPQPTQRPVVQRKPASRSSVQPESEQGDQTADTPYSEPATFQGEFVQREDEDARPSISEDYWSQAETESPSDEGAPSTFAASETGFVQREYEDAQASINEDYWSQAESTPDEEASSISGYPADPTSPVSAEVSSPPERPVVRRKTQAPPSASTENLDSDYVPVEYPDVPEHIEPPFEGEWENSADGLPFDSAADITPDAPPRRFTASPPNQIARQPDFALENDQPPYDAYSEEEPENPEQPVDVFQALVGAGMISPPAAALRIDRQAVQPEDNEYAPDEDAYSEEPYTTQQPVDLYQALMNSGMIPPSAGYTPAARQGEVARKAESPQESRSSNSDPDRVSVQYGAEPNRVMRAETASTPATTTSESSSTEQKSGDMDVDKLARDVYNTLRERLRIEKERRG